MAATTPQDHEIVAGLPIWFRKAVTKTPRFGVRVEVPHNRPATWKDADGTVRRLCKTESKQQFMFKQVGCGGGLQHFKLCTPAAVTSPNSLLCCFCAYMSDAWTAAGKRSLPRGELQFMALLLQQQQSCSWCFQVQQHWWGGCLDFFNYETRVAVQVDDFAHFQYSDYQDVFERDFCCNHAACAAGARLVRVHVADLHNADVVMAAIALASQHTGVVFTASYCGNGAPHVYALRSALGSSSGVDVDAFNNVRVYV